MAREWHLQRNLADKFPAAVQQDLTDPLHGKLKYAQLSEENWDAYRKLLRKRAAAEPGYAAAENAAVKLDGLIRTQAFARPDPSDGYPVSTGPLEQFFRTLELSLGDRAARLTNKRRADALLKLLAANRNGWVDHDACTTILREHLDARRGHAAEQRKHVDARSTPSVR